MAKTVVGLFESSAEAQRVVEDLVSAGFMRNDIGIISHHLSTAAGDEPETSTTAVGVGAGALVGSIGGLLVGLGALTIPGIGPILAAGPIATALAGAGVGAAAGGVLGAMADLGIPEDEAQRYAEGIRRGGTLVTVKTDDAGSERAMEVMYRHGPIDLEERAASWRERGWTGWAPTSTPYTTEELRRERELHPAGAVADRPLGRRHTTDAEDVGQPVREPGVYGGMRDRQGRGVHAYAPMTGATGWRGDDLEPDWRRHYDATLASGGQTWDQCAVAYRFGYDLEGPRQRALDWQSLESEARRKWEAEHPGTWERFKDAIRYAWERARGRKAA